MPTVFVPSSLRRYTAGQSKAQVSDGTINEIIEDLERQYPGVKSRRQRMMRPVSQTVAACCRIVRQVALDFRPFEIKTLRLRV